MCNKMCSPCCTQQQTLQHKLKRKMFIYAAACWRVKRVGKLAPQFPAQHLHFDAVLRMMWRAPANTAYQPHEIKRPEMKSEELQVGKLQEGADRGRWRAASSEQRARSILQHFVLISHSLRVAAATRWGFWCRPRWKEGQVNWPDVRAHCHWQHPTGDRKRSSCLRFSPRESQSFHFAEADPQVAYYVLFTKDIGNVIDFPV